MGNDLQNQDLSSLIICNPDECPMAEKCTVGPVPNLPCPIKGGFYKELNDQIALSFPKLDSNPEVALRVNLMLRPLFEQLLKLRMGEQGNPEVLFGTKANPMLKEIRQVILAMDKVMNETVRLYHDGPSRVAAQKNGGKKDPLDMAGKSYYDMLIIDGQTNVQDRVGIDDTDLPMTVPVQTEKGDDADDSK